MTCRLAGSVEGVLSISRSSAYRVPAGLSIEELDLMRKLDEFCIYATRSRALGVCGMICGMYTGCAGKS